ncbi:hypothetical protein SJI19_18040 [Acerihabitans sp. TG2]|nr:hypothetical protein [Acerihabitans sp. TG2]MEA9392419.1 hypothetical protein [Acerihabitans sp. TG2]
MNKQTAQKLIYIKEIERRYGYIMSNGQLVLPKKLSSHTTEANYD